jgi:hypothetical protein
MFFYKFGQSNPINIYAKSLIANVGNYIATEYMDSTPIFPTTYEELVAAEEQEAPSSITVDFDDVFEEDVETM